MRLLFFFVCSVGTTAVTSGWVGSQSCLHNKRPQWRPNNNCKSTNISFALKKYWVIYSQVYLQVHHGMCCRLQGQGSLLGLLLWGRCQQVQPWGQWAQLCSKQLWDFESCLHGARWALLKVDLQHLTVLIFNELLEPFPGARELRSCCSKPMLWI